jgi:hypothetical protein
MYIQKNMKLSILTTSPPHGFNQPKEGGIISGEQGAAADAGTAGPATASIPRANSYHKLRISVQCDNTSDVS